MSEYIPHRWLIVKLTTNEKSHYRVFACWYGGYTGSDSWKLNSGIESVVYEDEHYLFTGSSGSVYRCHNGNQGISGYGMTVLDTLIKQGVKIGTVIEVLADTVDPMELNYEYKD
jgi:hypothetical protein